MSDQTNEVKIDAPVAGVNAQNLKILRINTAGIPVEWLSWQEAVCLHAREMVTWTYGEEVMEVHGGYSRHNGRSNGCPAE